MPGWLTALALSSILALFGAPISLAQDSGVTSTVPVPVIPYDRDCMDEYGRDLCNAEVGRAIVESFGLAPAEELKADSGVDLRVFTIDGYSQDKPALVFHGLRSPAPRVDIYVAGSAKNPGGRRFNVNLTRDEVRRPLELMRRVRRAPLTAPNVMDPPRRPPKRRPNDGKSEEISELIICGHAWVTVLEVLDPGRLTRRIRNTCQTDGIADTALDWGDWVLERLPQCHALKGGRYRNNIVIVEVCATLSGDLSSAAAVRRLSDGHDFRAARLPDEQELSSFLLDRGRLRLPGKVIEGADMVREALRSFDGMPYVSAAEGVSPTEAVISGEVIRHEDGVRPVVEIIYAAPMTQRWVRTAEGWRLAEIDIGVYAEKDRFVEMQPSTAPAPQPGG